jgi:hypothetical protein
MEIPTANPREQGPNAEPKADLPPIGGKTVETASADDFVDALQSDSRPFHIEDPRAYLEERRLRRSLANAALGRDVWARRKQEQVSD